MKRIISAILAAVTLLVCLSAPAAADEGGYNFKFALLGDVNGDGVFDAIDYVMAKRAVIGSVKLTDLQAFCSDIDQNGSVGAEDYAMIKRDILGSYRFNHYIVRYNDEVIELKPFDDTDRIVVSFNLLPEITDEPDGSVTIYGLNVKSAELSPFLDAFLDGRLNHSSVLITVFDRTKLAGMIEFIKEQPGVISAEADFDMYPD